MVCIALSVLGPDALVVGGRLVFTDGTVCGRIVFGTADSVIGQPVRESAAARGCEIILAPNRLDFARFASQNENSSSSSCCYYY